MEYRELMKICNDSDARLDEKDDAIDYLSEFDNSEVIEFLIKIGSDSDQDDLLSSAAGESLGHIILKRDYKPDLNFIHLLLPNAKAELLGLLKTVKPDWLL
ncbi:MAG: hypothetical protein KDK41_17165 [Leptospiraceae bacterium]|nr:hypothetical protein [Leptospiraceae bacterium]